MYRYVTGVLYVYVHMNVHKDRERARERERESSLCLRVVLKKFAGDPLPVEGALATAWAPGRVLITGATVNMIQDKFRVP